MRYGQANRAPWLYAATADFMHPECTGDFPQEEMEALAALGALRERAMTGDRQAYRQLMNVSMLKVPLSSILPATGGNAEVAVV